MTFATPHMLLQWTARFREGTNATDTPREIVVGSMRFGGPGVAQADTDAVADAIVPVMQLWWADPYCAIPTNCFLDTIKWNRLNVEGKYATQGQTRLREWTGTKGGTEGRYPFQVAWATTWTTDLKRGRAHAGRTYWPTARTVSPATGTVSSGEAHDAATVHYRYLRAVTDAIQRAAGATVVPMVMSSIGSGTSAVITGAKQGTRLDIQRRRGSGIDERYEFADTTSVG